jgi:5-methyltetrahydrofolate--homocysteine methyltransferase
MGTELQKNGMVPGDLPEIFGMDHPDITEKIHRSYLEAGSRIIYANTFGANRKKLARSGRNVSDVVTANIRTAKKAAAGFGAAVALDIGPIGEMMSPIGTLSFDEAYEIFREIVKAGENAGADLIVCETFSDLQEIRTAVLAAKENADLPVFATMTFEERGRTFTGCLAESFAATVAGLHADAIGVNCSLGPQGLLPIIKRIGSVTELPLILKANAGLPDARDGHYSINAAEFAAEMLPLAELGVKFAGGCCGTDPDYIRELKKSLAAEHCAVRTVSPVTAVCSATKYVVSDRVRMIGERINPTGKKRFQQALKDHDTDYVLAQAVEEADAGADILDVNVGVPGLNECELMRDIVPGLMSVTDLPLQIDSASPSVIEAGLRMFAGKAIVNSVNGEDDRLEKILPIVKKYGAAVVGLTMDGRGIPEKAEERFAIALKIRDACRAAGIPDRDILIDCLTLTVSAAEKSAAETLKAVRMVREKLGLKTVLGVSNISFGLPERTELNRIFLTAAMEEGLDFPIMNPNTEAMTDAVCIFRLLHGNDPECGNYIARFGARKEREKPERQVQQKPQGTLSFETPEEGIRAAVLNGQKTEAVFFVNELLQKKAGLEIIEKDLIPALDMVGDKYEKGEIFLPQLLHSADASGEAFDVIKKSLHAEGSPAEEKGKIVVATVKGDIHDIGKNIVKTILMNYGYRVIDLGRDVPPEKIVKTVLQENAGLVGLSALMTTTLPSMEETVKKLRKSGAAVKIMVGGAVLTPEYAREIGADYYAKDAKRSADIAKEVLG